MRISGIIRQFWAHFPPKLTVYLPNADSAPSPIGRTQLSTTIRTSGLLGAFEHTPYIAPSACAMCPPSCPPGWAMCFAHKWLTHKPQCICPNCPMHKQPKQGVAAPRCVNPGLGPQMFVDFSPCSRALNGHWGDNRSYNPRYNGFLGLAVITCYGLCGS